MLWRMAAEPHLDRIAIMLARLDNFPQRHRSVTLHAAAPEVDFGISMRCERIPGRHDPCSRNTPTHACHAKPPAIGTSLAEIAGITRSWQRPARAGARDWHNACGNCGNPRRGPPARYRDKIEGRAERSETHFAVHPMGETAKLRTAISVHCLGLRGLRVKRGIGRGRRGARQSDDTRSA
jgi:hypothetical protein